MNFYITYVIFEFIEFIAVFHPRDRPTVQVVVGAPAELECLVNAPPDAELVTEWVTPADERIPGNRVTVRRHAPDSTIFHLESVSETDAGEYQCLVSSYTAGIDDATIRLEVVGKNNSIIILIVHRVIRCT